MIGSLFGKYLKASLCAQTLERCQPECERCVGLCWAWKSVTSSEDSICIMLGLLLFLWYLKFMVNIYVDILSIFWWRNGLRPAPVTSWPLVCSLLSSPLLPTVWSELSSQPFAWFMPQFFPSSACTSQGLPTKLSAACCFRGPYYVHQSLRMSRFGLEYVLSFTFLLNFSKIYGWVKITCLYDIRCSVLKLVMAYAKLEFLIS